MQVKLKLFTTRVLAIFISFAAVFSSYNINVQAKGKGILYYNPDAVHRYEDSGESDSYSPEDEVGMTLSENGNDITDMSDKNDSQNEAGTVNSGAKSGKNKSTSKNSPSQKKVSESSQHDSYELTRDDDRIHYIKLNGHTTQSSDAIVIESNGHFGLIDSSNKSDDIQYGIKIANTASGKQVLKYLNALGVTHLDFVLSTHSHSDHNGGFPEIAYSFLDETHTIITDKVDYISYESGEEEQKEYPREELSEYSYASIIDENTTYIVKGYIDNSREEEMYNNKAYYNDAMGAMQKTNILKVNNPSNKSLKKLGAKKKTHASSKLDDEISFMFGDFNISLYNLYRRSNTDENANSIVTYVEKNGVKTVLLADIDVYNNTEQKIAKAIVKQHGRINVIKVGHHGYFRSTSRELLDRFNAKIAIVSTCNSNMADYSPFYGYLKSKGAYLYRTMDQSSDSIVQEMTDKSSIMAGVILADQDVVLKRETEIKTENFISHADDKTINTVVTTTDEKKIVADTWLDVEDSAIMWTQKKGINQWSKWYTQYNEYEWVFVNKDGTNKTGWNKIRGYWYEFNKSGIMKTGWTTKKGKKVYLLDKTYMNRPKGSMMVGWYFSGDDIYYFKADGEAHTGWMNYQGSWYYLKAGVAVRGAWQRISDQHYYFDVDGKMKTGWLNLGGKWYFLEKSGAMVTGDKIIEGKAYHFTDDGVLQ